MNVPVRRRRKLLVPCRAPLGWDIELGADDDPEEARGRAALAARYFGQTLRDNARPGLRDAARRHLLLPRSSRFSFWSPSLEQRELEMAVARLAETPRSLPIRQLVDQQIALAESQLKSPQQQLINALDEAAWGRSKIRDLGAPATLRAITEPGLSKYIRRCVECSRVVNPIVATAPPTPIARSGRCRWHGGLQVVAVPGQQCRLGVSFVLSSGMSDHAAVLVLTEFLGGQKGLLRRRLRDEAGLIYGSAVMFRREPGTSSVSIGVSSIPDHLPQLVPLMHELLAEIDSGFISPEELVECAYRVEHRLLDELSGPFGKLTDYRRAVDGDSTTAELVSQLSCVPQVLCETSRISSSHSLAVAYVGDPRLASMSDLEQLL
ncbi:insulinase family protein [Micromonospora sp. CA-248089]|uniref:insulinase family protein n=1 Tax=Micromonospora sp. CA-248089 TaxID=3239960 RepID=UPI003D8A34E6